MGTTTTRGTTDGPNDMTPRCARPRVTRPHRLVRALLSVVVIGGVLAMHALLMIAQSAAEPGMAASAMSMGLSPDNKPILAPNGHIVILSAMTTNCMDHQCTATLRTGDTPTPPLGCLAVSELASLFVGLDTAAVRASPRAPPRDLSPERLSIWRT